MFLIGRSLLLGKQYSCGFWFRTTRIHCSLWKDKRPQVPRKGDIFLLLCVFLNCFFGKKNCQLYMSFPSYLLNIFISGIQTHNITKSY